MQLEMISNGSRTRLHNLRLLPPSLGPTLRPLSAKFRPVFPRQSLFDSSIPSLTHISIQSASHGSRNHGHVDICRKAKRQASKECPQQSHQNHWPPPVLVARPSPPYPREKLTKVERSRNHAHISGDILLWHTKALDHKVLRTLSVNGVIRPEFLGFLEKKEGLGTSYVEEQQEDVQDMARPKSEQRAQRIDISL